MIVLWGAEEYCKEAVGLVSIRISKCLTKKRYYKSNRESSTHMANPSMTTCIRICPDGSSWSREHMLSIIASEVNLP